MQVQMHGGRSNVGAPSLVGLLVTHVAYPLLKIRDGLGFTKKLGKKAALSISFGVHVHNQQQPA